MTETTSPADGRGAPGPKPTFFVIGDILHYQSKKGDELTFDLDFPSEILEKTLEGDKDEREQFFVVLSMLGDEKMQQRIRSMGALEQNRLIRGFFESFQEAVDAPLGKSGGSSDS